MKNKFAAICETRDGLLAPVCRTVTTVAWAGSFSAAARIMGIRQSTVSRQIRALEDQVGVSLFERCGGGTKPTDAGRQLLARLDQLGGLAKTAVGEASDFGTAHSGRLRLGFIGSFAASPAKDILARLRGLHPGLQIQLVEAGAAELVRQVVAHELDCAWVSSWRSPDPVLVFEQLWSEPLYLAVPAGRSGGDTANWSDLSGQILLARPEAELDLLMSVLKRARVSPPDVQFHDCSRESLVSLVASGDGVSILPESFARTGRTGVRFLRLSEDEAQVEVGAMYRRDRDNPALRRLLAIARDWLRLNQASPAPSSAPG